MQPLNSDRQNFHVSGLLWSSNHTNQHKTWRHQTCAIRTKWKLISSTHFLATFWMVHCSRRMHESLTSGAVLSVVVDLSWPWRQLANSSTSMHIGTRLRHNVCICFCTRAALSHWQTHNNGNLISHSEWST